MVETDTSGRFRSSELVDLGYYCMVLRSNVPNAIAWVLRMPIVPLTLFLGNAKQLAFDVSSPPGERWADVDLESLTK